LSTGQQHSLVPPINGVVWSGSKCPRTNSSRYHKLNTANDLLSNVVHSPFAYLANSIDPSCEDQPQFFDWDRESNFRTSKPFMNKRK
jgi:hypothetical protein